MAARVASASGQGVDENEAERALLPADAVLDALWLTTLQTICSRAAHDVRGALNAVAVNLEVARSRSEKPGVPASAITAFANVACGQLESVVAMTEALMFLARAGRGPTDVGAEVARVVTLLAPAARANGRTVELDHGFGGLGTTSATTSSARLAIGQCLLAATDASANVRCIAGGAAGPQLLIEHDREAISIAPSVLDALTVSDIEVRTEPSVISVTFPR